MTITHRTLIGEDGKPEAALIPWSVFVELQELLGGEEASPEEIEAVREAENDRRNGNKEAFIPLVELEKELGI
jgi:hypothetical protein